MDMTILQATALGLLQGLTEFLPVSSSGHLQLGREWFGLSEISHSFDIFMHLGTILAVFVFFRQKIGQLFFGLIKKEKVAWEFAGFVFLASIPTAVIGLIIDHFFNDNFPLWLTGLGFFITGTMLIYMNKLTERFEDLSFSKSIFIGIIQGLAVFSGISRSGSTIFAGVFGGISKKNAFEFSFLVSIPAILGANLLKINEIFESNVGFGNLIVGVVFSFLAGILSLFLLEKILIKNKFSVFAPYLFLLGTLSLLRVFGVL